MKYQISFLLRETPQFIYSSLKIFFSRRKKFLLMNILQMFDWCYQKNAWSLSAFWNLGSTQQNLCLWMALSFPFTFMTPSAFLRPLPGSLYAIPLLQMNSTVYCHSILPDCIHFNTSLFSLQKCLNSSHIHFWDVTGWPMNWLLLTIIAALAFSRETEPIRYMNEERSRDADTGEEIYNGNWLMQL